MKSGISPRDPQQGASQTSDPSPGCTEADPPPTPHPLELRPPGRGGPGSRRQARHQGRRPCPRSSKEGAWSPSPSAAEVGSRPAVACVPGGGRRPLAAGVAPSVPRPLRLAQLGPQPHKGCWKEPAFRSPLALATTIAPAPSPPHGGPGQRSGAPPRRKNRRGGDQVSGHRQCRLLHTAQNRGMRSCRKRRTPAAPGEEAGWASSSGDAGPASAVLGRRLERARALSGRFPVVTHVPDLRGEGRCSCPPARGAVSGPRARLPASHRRRLLLSRKPCLRAGKPGTRGRWVWPALRCPSCRLPRWPAAPPLPPAPLSVNPGGKKAVSMGARGSRTPCWGGGGWSLTLAPQTFQIPRIGCKRPPPCSES